MVQRNELYSTFPPDQKETWFLNWEDAKSLTQSGMKSIAKQWTPYSSLGTPNNLSPKF